MYQIEIDSIDKHAWHSVLQSFDDANIYQTWSLAAARWGAPNLSHLILKRHGVIVAAAQITLSCVPLVGAGIAHVKFGPLWRRRGQPHDRAIYAQVIRALRQEYAQRRGLVLRIKPWAIDPDTESLRRIREAEGLRWQYQLEHYITFIIDLAHSSEQLYQGLKPNWRRHLKQARRRALCVEPMAGARAVDIFIELYSQMRAHKGFHDTSEATLLPIFYADLPDPLKPKIIISTHRGEPVAADVISALGTSGFCMFGATSPKGRELGASYLAQWWTVLWLKQQGCRWCDLVGGHADVGVRQFKAGLTGQCGQLAHMGDFDAHGSLASRVAVSLGGRVRQASRGLGHRLGRLRGRWSLSKR